MYGGGGGHGMHPATLPPNQVIQPSYQLYGTGNGKPTL